MRFLFATALNTSDENVKEVMNLPVELYQKLAGILIIAAVVMTIFIIIFLMYTRDDKSIGRLRDMLKRIFITVIIFLTLGSFYAYLMGRAQKDDWDPDVPISFSQPAPPEKDGDHTSY